MVNKITYLFRQILMLQIKRISWRKFNPWREA